MCGIAGAYGWSDRQVLEGMLDSIAHRGPDQRGALLGESVMLGACRLSIVDLAGGAQPVSNEDGTVHVVFNGEIYNHETLRERLKSAGHRFESRCDTEVLAHLWEEYGTEVPCYLEGMFAFAVYDVESEEVFLARDRLGVKPLYYTKTADGLVWASEIPPILDVVRDPTVSRTAVAQYFSLKYSLWPETMVEGIRKVPPGTSLLVGPESVERRRFWSLPVGTVDTTMGTAADRVRELLETSVSNRLMADVPVGAFLSGGLDSSAVVGLMARETDALDTYSVGFEPEDFDESREAEFVANHFGTTHHTIDVDPESMDVFGQVIRYHGEPLADAAALPTLLLSQQASEDVKVVLTGTGADELFAGYRKYELLDRHRRRLGWLPPVAYELAAAVAPHAPVGERYLEHFGGLRSDETAYVQWHTRKLPGLSAFTSIDSEKPVTAAVRRDLPEGADPFQRLTGFDARHYLSDDLLAMLDQMTMAASIEGRVPFLDHRLVEYVHQVPREVRTQGAYKPLLRRAMADVLPERTRSRSKQQFAVPIGKWFREDAEPITRWLTESNVADAPFLDVSAVFDCWDAHRRSRSDNTSTLWRVLNYVVWYHTVFRRAE